MGRVKAMKGLKMQLKRTQKNLTKLVRMARECNSCTGTQDWADAYDIDEIDDVLADMKPSEIIRSLFFGDIDEGVNWINARIRFNGYGNLEIISEYQLKQEAWDNRDDILEDYKEVASESEYKEALQELDFEED